jgi:CopG family transcriptional regulator/antitoxin EndoAI
MALGATIGLEVCPVRSGSTCCLVFHRETQRYSIFAGGDFLLAKCRRIVVSLPDTLLVEVDHEIQTGNCNRSEFIREGLEYYMAERKKRTVRQKLAEGYTAMATLNLELAQEVTDDLGEYELALSEGD